MWIFMFYLSQMRWTGSSKSNYKGVYVITVYRNRKCFDPTKKFKALHLPFKSPRGCWADEVRPFKFNPKADKDKQQPRYFIKWALPTS
jgi:hypothetical protein